MTTSDEDLRMAIARLGRRIRLERVQGDMADGRLSALFVLHNSGPQTLGSLSEQERVTPPSMNRTVNALEEAGLVTRSGDPADGRKVLIAITDAGREIVLETRRMRAVWFSHALETLSDDERATLDAALPILRRLADS
jgi:DNA-binding MarR family transcriptional regulator